MVTNNMPVLAGGASDQGRTMVIGLFRNSMCAPRRAGLAGEGYVVGGLVAASWGGRLRTFGLLDELGWV